MAEWAGWLLIHLLLLLRTPAQVQRKASFMRSSATNGAHYVVVSLSHTNALVFTYTYIYLGPLSPPRNSIDVDKFDYIARDSKHVGMRSGFDHER
jgi:hypothetical protein